MSPRSPNASHPRAPTPARTATSGPSNAPLSPREMEDLANLAPNQDVTDPWWGPRIRAELNPFHPHAGHWEVRTPIPPRDPTTNQMLLDLRESQWHHAWFLTADAAETAAIATWQRVHARKDPQAGTFTPRTDRPNLTWQYQLTYDATNPRHQTLYAGWRDQVQPQLATYVASDAIMVVQRHVPLDTPEPVPNAPWTGYPDPDRSQWAPDDAIWDQPGRPFIQPNGKWMRGESLPAAWNAPDQLAGHWHWARLTDDSENGVLYRVDATTMRVDFWPDLPHAERPWQGPPEALEAEGMATAMARAGATVQSQEPDPNRVDPAVRESWWRWHDRIDTIRAQHTGAKPLPYAGSLHIETGDESLPTDLTGFSWGATETTVHGQSTWFLWKPTERRLAEGGHITTVRALVTDPQGAPRTFARFDQAETFAHNAGATVEIMRNAEAIAAFKQAAADLPAVRSARPSAWMVLPAGTNQAVVGRLHPDTGRLELAPKVEREQTGPPLVLSRATAESSHFFPALCAQRRWGSVDRHLDPTQLEPALATALLRALRSAPVEIPPGLAEAGRPVGRPPVEDPNATGWRLVRPTKEARWIAVRPIARDPRGPVSLIPLLTADHARPVTFGPEAMTPQALETFATRHHLTWHPTRIDSPDQLPPSWKAPMRELLNRFRVRGPETPGSPGAPPAMRAVSPSTPTLARP